MLDVPDLMIDLAQHSALGAVELFPPPAAPAFLGELGLETRGNLVPVPPFGPQQAAIEDERKVLGADRGVVHLAKVRGADVPDLLISRWHRVGCAQFMLGAIPSDLDLDRQIISPVCDHKRRFSPGVGQQETTVFNANRGCFPDDLEEALSLVGGLEVRVEGAGLAPAVEGAKEALNRGLSRLRMEDGGLAVVQAALHGSLRQPLTVTADMPPEPDDGVRVDAPRRSAQGIDLGDDAEFPFPDNIHRIEYIEPVFVQQPICEHSCNSIPTIPRLKSAAFALDLR